MSLDPHAQRFLDRLVATRPSNVLSLTVRERREALSQLLSFTGGQVPVSRVENRSIPGPAGEIRIRIYTPTNPEPNPLPAMIYFHGGGFVAGSLDSHDAIGRSLSNASGCRLISVDYRLAPENPFPAAIADGCSATRWIAAHAAEFDIDPNRIVVCGDSAGATLAAVVCQTIAANRDTPVALQVLVCPITDYSAQAPSRSAFAEGYFLNEATLEHDLKHYLTPGIRAQDPRVSPLCATDLGALPAACIHTAEFDPVRDEGEAYANKLRLAGVSVIYRCHPGMIHLFYGMSMLIPYARTAYELLGADIRSRLEASRTR